MFVVLSVLMMCGWHVEHQQRQWMPPPLSVVFAEEVVAVGTEVFHVHAGVEAAGNETAPEVTTDQTEQRATQIRL